MGRPGCGCCVECATTYKVNKETGRIEWAKNLGVNTLAIAASDDRVYVSLEKSLSMGRPESITEDGQILLVFGYKGKLAFVVDDADTFEVGDKLLLPLFGDESENSDVSNTTLEGEIIEILDEEEILVTDIDENAEIIDLILPRLPYEFVRRSLFEIIAKYDIVVLDMGGSILEDECISVLPDNVIFPSARFTKLYIKNDFLFAFQLDKVVKIDIETKKIVDITYMDRDNPGYTYSNGKLYFNSPPNLWPLEYLIKNEDGYEIIQKTSINQLNAEHKEEFDIGRSRFAILSGNLEDIIIYNFDTYEYITLGDYSGEYYKYTIEQTEEGAKLTFDEEMLDTVYPFQDPPLRATVSGLGTQRNYYQALDNSRIYQRVDDTAPTYSGSLTINKVVRPGPLYQSLQDGQSRNFPGYGYRIVNLEDNTQEYDFMDDPQATSEFRPFNYSFHLSTMSGDLGRTFSRDEEIQASSERQAKIDYSIDDLTLIKNYRGDLTWREAQDLIARDFINEPLNPSAFQAGTHFLPNNTKPKEIDGKLRQTGVMAFIYPIFFDGIYDRIDYPDYDLSQYEIALTTESIAAKIEGRTETEPYKIAIQQDDIQGYELFKYKVLYGYYIRYFDATVEYDIGSKNYTLELNGEAYRLKSLAGNNLICVIENGDIVVDQNDIFNLEQDITGTTGIGVWVQVNYYDYFDLYKDTNTPLKYNRFRNKSSYYINIENTDSTDLLVNDSYYQSMERSEYLDTLTGGYGDLEEVFLSPHYHIPSWAPTTVSFLRNFFINDNIYEVFNTSQLKLDVDDVGKLMNKYIETTDSGAFPINSRTDIIYVDDKDYIVTDSYDGDRIVTDTAIKFYTVANNNIAPIESTIISLNYPYRGTNAKTEFDWVCPIGYYETYTRSGVTDTLYYSGVPIKIDVYETVASGLVQEILDNIDIEEKPDIKILSEGPLVSGEITLLIDNSGKEFTLADNEFILEKRLIVQTGSTSIEPGAFVAKTNPINSTKFSGAFNYDDKVIGLQYFAGQGPNITDLTTGTRSLWTTEETNTAFRTRFENDGGLSGVPFVDIWQYDRGRYIETGPIWPIWDYNEGTIEVNTLANHAHRYTALVFSGYPFTPLPIPTLTVSGYATNARFVTSEQMMENGLESTDNRYNTYVSIPPWDGISVPYAEAGLKTFNSREFFNNRYNGNGLGGFNRSYKYNVTGRAFPTEYTEKIVPSGGVIVTQDDVVESFDSTISNVNRDGWVVMSEPSNLHKFYRTIVTPNGEEVSTSGLSAFAVGNGPFQIGLDGTVYTSGVFDKKISIQELWYDSSILGAPLNLSYKTPAPTDNPNIEKFFSFVYEETAILTQFASNWIMNIGSFFDEEKGFDGALIFGGTFQDGKAYWNGEEFFDISDLTGEYHTWNLLSSDYVDSDDVLEDYGEEPGTALVYCGKADGQAYSYKYRYQFHKLIAGENNIEGIACQRYAFFKDDEIEDIVIGPVLENIDLIGWGSGAYCPYPTEAFYVRASGYVTPPSGEPIYIEFDSQYAMSNVGLIPNVGFETCHIIGVKDSGLVTKTLSRGYNADPQVEDAAVEFNYIANSPHPTKFWAFAISGAFQELIIQDEARISFNPIRLKESGSIYEDQKFNILAFGESGVLWKSNYLMNPRKYNSFMEEHMQWNDYDHDKVIKDVTSNKDYLFLTGEKRKKISAVTRNERERNTQEATLRNNYCGEDFKTENLKINDPEYNYWMIVDSGQAEDSEE